MKKNKNIDLPDLTKLSIFEDEDLVNLGEKILQILRNQIGCEELYVIYKDYVGEHTYKKCSIKDIRFTQERYNSCIDVTFQGIYNSIQFICKNQKDAEDYCNKNNISFLEKQIERIKKEIDDINPIKVIEETEEKRTKLLERYQQCKLKLEETQKLIEESEKNV